MFGKMLLASEIYKTERAFFFMILYMSDTIFPHFTHSPIFSGLVSPEGYYLDCSFRDLNFLIDSHAQNSCFSGYPTITTFYV